MSHQFVFSPYILDNLPVPSVGFDVVRDIAEQKLRLYITSRGVKTFFVRKRVRGKDTRIIIGNYPRLSIESARAKVPAVLAAAAKPVKRRRKKIAFGEIVKIYLEKYVRRDVLAKIKFRRGIEKHFAALLPRAIQEISADEVAAAVAKISGAPTANRMAATIGSIWGYAESCGYKVAEIKLQRRPETRRKRSLTAAKLRALAAAFRKEKRPAFLMLVYSFLPRGKVFSMRWFDIDFNQYSVGGFPLSDKAAALLEAMPQSGKWVFAGRSGHLTDPRKAWREVAGDIRISDIYKFLIKKLDWSADRETLRRNMNKLLDDLGIV